MLEAYAPRDSWLHRAPAGAKLAALAMLCTMAFLSERLDLIALSLLGALALYRSARLTLRHAWAQLRPALWFLIAIAIAQAALRGAAVGLFVALRFALLLLIAGLLTLTTRASEMMEALERSLRILRPLGVDPAKVGLAFSLTLRFIPLLSEATRQVREAQRARGLERNLLALAIPVVVRTLRTADAVAEALDARGYASSSDRS